MLRLEDSWNIMSKFCMLCGGMGYVIFGEHVGVDGVIFIELVESSSNQIG